MTLPGAICSGTGEAVHCPACKAKIADATVICRGPLDKPSARAAWGAVHEALPARWMVGRASIAELRAYQPF